MSKKIKRFYSNVEVTASEKGFVVELDGRPVKSPGRKVIFLPRENFAQSLADEWQEQEEFIDLALMPVMRFTGMVNDNFIPNPDEARAEILKYAHSDLLCYRAESPDTLVQNQQRSWGPVLERFKREKGIDLKTSRGILYVEQGKDDMDRFESLVRPIEAYELGAVHLVTTMSGSAALAMALFRGWYDSDTIWELSHLDEDYQIEQWGSDSDEEERRQRRYLDFNAAAQFLK